jgi:hypothetical protein
MDEEMNEGNFLFLDQFWNAKMLTNAEKWISVSFGHWTPRNMTHRQYSIYFFITNKQ